MTLDTQLFFFFNSLAGQSQALDAVIIFFASYLPYILVAAFLILVFFSAWPRREKIEMLAVAFAASLVARFGVTEMIRFFYHRPRPFVTLDIHPLFTDSAWSFPSGHATFFFAMATVVYLYNKRWGIWFFAAAIAITMSRVVAGVHYPSDIIVGAVIGALVAYATVSFARNVRPPRAD